MYLFPEIGTSDDPCSNTYAGPLAFSEVEIQAMSSFLMQHKDDFLVYLSIHAYGQYWLTPWSYTDTPPDDYNDLVSHPRYSFYTYHTINMTGT